MRPGSRRHAIWCYDHGLGGTTQVVHDIAAEMLNRNFYLLSNRGRVYANKTHHVRDGFTKVDGVLATEFVADTSEHRIGGIVGQHIKNKALLDSLAHLVGVERHPLVRVIGIDHAVGRQGLRLRRGRQRDKAQVRGVGHGLVHGQQNIITTDVVTVGHIHIDEDLAQSGGSLAMLGGMSLVHDHTVVAASQRRGLLHHLCQRREGLDGTRDDVTTTGQCRLESLGLRT